MQKTIFDSPRCRKFMQKFSYWFFKANDWGVTCLVPIPEKCVISAVPHRTWQDLPYTIMLAFVLKLHIRMMAKEELFKAPFKATLLWLGCIPVERDTSTGQIKLNAKRLRDTTSPLQLVFPPAGTRDLETNKNILKWRTGFYFTAKEAQVPIVLFFIDYKKRKVIVGKIVTPTDDHESDLQIIWDFYKPFISKESL